MLTMNLRLFKRVKSRLKNIVREEIDADFRLNHAEKAIVAGLGFEHMHALCTALPCEVEWSGQNCADYLYSNGFIQKREDAEQAVDWLEEDLGHILLSAGPPYDLPSTAAPAPMTR